MAHQHVTVELARAIARGERNPGDLAAKAITALRDACPRCAAGLDAFDRERSETGEPMLLDYGQAYERAMERLGAQAAEIEVAKEKARPLLDALLAMPEGERLQVVEAEGSEFQSVALAQALLDHCLTCLPGRAKECLALAELAALMVARLELSPISTEVYARALAHQANALRSVGRLRQAAKLFHQARFMLKLEAGGDRLVAAEVDWLEGSLCRAQRRLEDASTLLLGAITVYRLENLSAEAARSMLTLSLVLREQGELEQALSISREALALIDPEEQPRLFLMASHNIAFRLAELGRCPEARALSLDLTELYQRFPDPCTQLRRLWLEAKIHRGLGELANAEQCFLAARDGFVRQGIGFDAALASLDLALLYLDQGRTGEVRRLAEEMVPIFAAQDVHREATAALLLFQEAARREEMTGVLVREVFAFLEAARMNPGLQFEANRRRLSRLKPGERC